MALIENIQAGTRSFGALSSAWHGLSRRRDGRRFRAELAGKPDRLLRDMGIEPAAVHTDSWAFALGAPQAVGNRP